MDTVEAMMIDPGQRPPAKVPARAVFGIDAKALGPDAFLIDGLLDAATGIYLLEEGHTLDTKAVLHVAQRGVLVLITAGASFRTWFAHIERLGLMDRLLAQGISGDPRGPLQ